MNLDILRIRDILSNAGTFCSNVEVQKPKEGD